MEPGRWKTATLCVGCSAWLALQAWMVVGVTAVTGVFQTPSPVFELEIPELNVAPTAQSEIPVSSTLATRINIHIRRPVADAIDYGQVYTFLNGEAAALISQVTSGEHGKVVRMDLKYRPGFELAPGRNTVEISATNRRGRVYYASFLLRTMTENRNEGFTQTVELGPDPKRQVPPEVLILDPEQDVEVRPGRKTAGVRIRGIATAADSVRRITANGIEVPLKRGDSDGTRRFGLTNEDNRVSFDFVCALSDATTRIVVEAVDESENRTRVQIPVRLQAQTAVSGFTGRKYALIAGISDFLYTAQGIPNLKFADADARDVHEFLQSPAGGRFKPEDMVLLTNRDATLARFRRALNDILAKTGPEDLVVVFLASHGGPDPAAAQNLYFVFHDTNLERMPETAFLMKDMQAEIARNAKVRRLVLLVDTCHSAGLTLAPSPGTRSFGLNLVNLYAEKLLYKEEGRAVLTSSDVNETSREAVRWGGGHGVFTHYILDGLRGKADSNEDKVVTVGELFRYVRRNVRRDTEFKQNPRLLVGTNDNLALASVTSNRR